MKGESDRKLRESLEADPRRPRYASLPHEVRWADLPGTKIRIVGRRVVWEAPPPINPAAKPGGRRRATAKRFSDLRLRVETRREH